MVCIVATVLTACGIETEYMHQNQTHSHQLQQCLPLAVLKHSENTLNISLNDNNVATVLTACGIETF